MLVEMDDVIGVSEIAELLEVSCSAVCNFRKRYHDFPPPIKVLAMGPLYSRKAVIEWANAHDR
jgi:hypothetical protein